MTLVADVSLSFFRVARWIIDCLLESLHGFATRCSIDVVLARPVTALASNPFGHCIGKRVNVPNPFRQQARVGGMTEHTGLRNCPCEIWVILGIISRRHPPALLLRVPTDGQLSDYTILVMVEVGASVITGADDITHFFFVNIDGSLMRVQQIPSLIELPVLV
jgi:hypothetical protein